MKLKYGIGYNDRKYMMSVGSKQITEYILWNAMLRRCYDIKCHETQPTYKDCTVSDNFKSYSYFYEWCHQQIGFGREGWNLDKDILIKGNKVYSEDNCVFVPSEINMLFTKHSNKRGLYPIGVYFNKSIGKYTTHCRIGNGDKKYIGSYSTVYEAFMAYKNVKENYIKEVTMKYITELDSRLVEVLINYSVDITD